MNVQPKNDITHYFYCHVCGRVELHERLGVIQTGDTQTKQRLVLVQWQCPRCGDKCYVQERK